MQQQGAGYDPTPWMSGLLAIAGRGDRIMAFFTVVQNVCFWG
jgi:hypothetical protein